MNPLAVTSTHAWTSGVSRAEIAETTSWPSPG
jgi:hypothetical protein